MYPALTNLYRIVSINVSIRRKQKFKLYSEKSVNEDKKLHLIKEKKHEKRLELKQKIKEK